jgi:hypothetical protein
MRGAPADSPLRASQKPVSEPVAGSRVSPPRSSMLSKMRLASSPGNEKRNIAA